MVDLAIASAGSAAGCLLIMMLATPKGRRRLRWAVVTLPANAIFRLLGGRM